MELPLLLDSKQVLELLAMSNWNAHFRLEISFGKFALIFMTSCFSRKFPFRKTKLNHKVTCKRESAEIELELVVLTEDQTTNLLIPYSSNL